LGRNRLTNAAHEKGNPVRTWLALLASLVLGGCASAPLAQAVRSDSAPVAEDTVLLLEETTSTTVVSSAARSLEMSRSHWGLIGLRSITRDSAEAWYEALDIWLADPQGEQLVDTQGALYQPFVLVFDQAGNAETRARPDFSRELLEATDLTRQFHDFFPPRPPEPLRPGFEWTDTLRVDEMSEKGERFRMTRIGRYEVEGRVQIPGASTDAGTDPMTMVTINETASYSVVIRIPLRDQSGVTSVTRLEGRYDGWYSVPETGGLFVQRERDFVLRGTIKYAGGDESLGFSIEQRHQNWSGRFSREEWEAALAESDTTEYVYTTFDWPIGSEVSVEARERHVRTFAGATRGFVIETGYTMAVEEHPEGLLVRHGDVEVRSVEADPPLSEGTGLTRLAASLAQHKPNLVVSRSGLLLEVEGLAETTATMSAAAKPWLDSLTAEGTELPGLLGYMIGGDFLLDQYSDRWNSLIGLWSGGAQGVGQVTRAEVEMPSPLGPGVQIPMEIELSLPGRVPCTDTDPTDSCVELLFTAVADREQALIVLDEVYQQVMQSLAGRVSEARGGWAFELADFAHEQRVRVVARPESLLPYRFEYLRVVRLELLIDGVPNDGELIDEVVHTFRYE
jgi:hypothetical protein